MIIEHDTSVREECMLSCVVWGHRELLVSNIRGDILYYDAENMKKKGTLNDVHSLCISKLVLNPDETRLISVSIDCMFVVVWDMETYTVYNKIPTNPSMCYGVSWIGKKPLIATAGSDKTLYVINTENSEIEKKIDINLGCVLEICSNREGTRLALSSVKGFVHVVDFESGLTIWTLSNHVKSCRSIMFSPINEFIISSSDDCSINISDISQQSTVKNFVGHNKPVFCIDVDKNERYLICGCNDGKVIVWDVEDNEEVFSAQENFGEIWGLSYSPDNSKFVTVGSEGIIDVYKVVK